MDQLSAVNDIFPPQHSSE